MENVFDLVADFYDNDEEWNAVLHRSNAEDFLRSKAWSGATQEELFQYWDKLMTFLLYLGNSDNYLGDMRRENYIDCFAWCCRNVAEFPATAEHAEEFLDFLSELCRFFKRKRVISYDRGPAEAKAKLVVNGSLQLLDSEGCFLPEYARQNGYSTPDLPAKIFLDINYAMQGVQSVMEALHSFFVTEEYKSEIERAGLLYSTMCQRTDDKFQGTPDDQVMSFWNYFLLDYHMMIENMTPLKFFYETYRAGKLPFEAKFSTDVLEVMQDIHLAAFEAVTRIEEGVYDCRDLLTDEHYILGLPIDTDKEAREFIFVGHIFYGDTVLLNGLHGLQMSKRSRKQFYKAMQATLRLAAVRYENEHDWKRFIAENPLVLLQLSFIYAAGMHLALRSLPTQLPQYRPQPLVDDKVSRALESPIWYSMLAAHGVLTLKQLWSDFVATSGKNVDLIKVPEVWAAAVAFNYIRTNAVYDVNVADVARLCELKSAESLRVSVNKISTVLSLVPKDPRYLGEEGLLLLLIEGGIEGFEM